MDERASQTASSTSGGVDLASLRGLLGRSDSGSPHRARESHLPAVCLLTPIWRATADTRSPPATREASSSRPLGVSLALGCCDMGGLPSAADLGNPQHAGALPVCHPRGVNNVLALNS